MTKREQYENKTEALLLPILADLAFELVDIEYVKEGSDFHLRIYMDKPDGITIDDCEAVSRRLSDLLDEADFISEAYVLEVSSPGLGRALKKEKDFARSLGKAVEGKLFARKVAGKKAETKEFCGVLRAYDAETIVVETEDGTQETYLRKELALLRLAIDF